MLPDVAKFQLTHTLSITEIALGI